MTKKIYLQLFLIFIFLIISLFIFLKYFKDTSSEGSIDKNFTQTTTAGESLIVFTVSRA